MKIICDSCGAKYSIADEKVQGKVFKIRCKKCSEVIVVEGTSEAASQAQDGGGGYSAAYQTGGAAEWYVVLDGERVGPITPEEVEAYFTAGQLEEESYIWRDGLDDWVMLETVSEFAHLVQQNVAGPNDKTMIADQSGRAVGGAEAHVGDSDQGQAGSGGFAEAGFGGGQAAQQGAGGYDYDGDDDATAVMDPDQFRDESFGTGQQEEAQFQPNEEVKRESGSFAAVESGSYGQQSGGAMGATEEAGGYDDDYDADQGGMFAAFDSDPDSGGGYDAGFDDPAASPDLSAGGDAGNDLVGARNENSVLFSLSSVDQVQAVSKNDAPGQAQGNDKSGLIDIQALASTHAAMKDGAGPSQSDDEEFVAGTMSMPALMPSGSHKSNKGLIIGISIAAAILVVGLGAVIAFLVLSDDEPEQIIVAEASDEDEDDAASEEEDAEAQAALEAAQAVEEGREPEEDGEETAEEDEEEAEEEETEVAEASTRSRTRSSTRSSTRSTRSSTRSSGSSSTSSGSSSGGSSGSSGGSSGSSGSSGGGILDQIDSQDDSSASSQQDLPESLSRSMVRNTIRRYSSQVSGCSRNSNPDGLSGNAMVRFVVTGSGNVSSASAQGEFSGTEVGRCIEGVVRSMKFPETQTASRSITYPFTVR